MSSIWTIIDKDWNNIETQIPWKYIDQISSQKIILHKIFDIKLKIAPIPDSSRCRIYNRFRRYS